MRQSFLPFSLPEIGEEEIAAVADTLRSGWLTTGPRTREFESAFAQYVGASHAIAVNSCTAALHLALDAIGVGPGDEVIVPTMTFAATGEVVHYMRAKPVLADCEADTLNLSAEAFERAITPRTKAVVPVHMAGQPCDMDSILGLARARGIHVIEDAAHALPSGYQGHRIGTLSDITCFSFYATKTITTGEGGMLATENDAYAERARRMSLHGISKDAWKRYSAEGSWYYEIEQPGFKYNLTDISAAIGLAQLGKCDRLRDKRTRLAEVYSEELSEVEELCCPSVRAGDSHSWHLYVIQLKPERLLIDRARFIELLRAANIGSAVHFIPLHMHPYYRNTYGYRPQDLPTAAAAYERIVSLPIYPGMTLEDARYVASTVKNVLRTNRR